MSAWFQKKDDSSFSLKDDLMIHLLLLGFMATRLYLLYFFAQKLIYLRAPWMNYTCSYILSVCMCLRVRQHRAANENVM